MKQNIKFWLLRVLLLFILCYLIILILDFLQVEYLISYSLLLGFLMIILAILYIFFKKETPMKEINLNYRCKVNLERMVKFIILILMIITSFIPPVSFSEMIIDWNQISILNYIRCIIFLLGTTFLPGSAIFRLMFKNRTLFTKLRVNPVIIKMTIYPLLSLSLIGLMSLILDFFNLKERNITILILGSIFFLSFLDIFVNKKDYYSPKLKSSKHNGNLVILILLIIGTFLISFSIFFASKYLIPGDSWSAISYVRFIGDPNMDITKKFYSYTSYWGYITFGLSKLCGIPAINVNVMLFPYLYLYVTSTYLFFDAVLFRFDKKYSLLSTILMISFSGIIFLYSEDIENIDTILFTVFGMYTFIYRSFSYFSLFVSMGIYSIAINLEIKTSSKNLKFYLIVLSSFLLLQSYMTYFFPALVGLIYVICYTFFKKEKSTNNFRILIYFLTSFFFLYVIFDIFSFFFFSWIPSTFISYFIGIPEPILEVYLVINALLIYFLMVISLVVLIITGKIVNKYYKTHYKKYHKIKIEYFFLLGLLIFSILLVIEILINLLNFEYCFFTYLLNALISNIGVIGILGIYLSYFSYKKKKELFKILIFWFIIIVLVASIFIIVRWWQYPFTNPSEIPSNESKFMIYWFNRLWYFSVIPLSALASIGILEFIKKIKESRVFGYFNDNFISFFKLAIMSIIILFSLTNSIISAINWYKIPWYIDDDEAHIIGWVSENVPQGSNVLIDSHDFIYQLDKLAFTNTFFINDEIGNAIVENNVFDLNNLIKSKLKYDENCSITLLERYDNLDDVIVMSDYNSNGLSSVEINSINSQINGTINLSFKISNTSKGFEVKIKDIFNNTGFYFKVLSKSIYTINNSILEFVTNINDNYWIEMKIEFECSNNAYKGLIQNSYNLEINGTNYGPFLFSDEIDQIKLMSFQTHQKNRDYITYINDIKLSWVPADSIDKFVLIFKIIVAHLEKYSINYYIHNLYEINCYKILSEKYITIEDELINQYYTIELFEYKNYVVYKSQS